MRAFRHRRNLIGLSCLLVLASCATPPPTPTTSDAAAATVDQAESTAPAVSSIAFRGSPARGDTYGLGETVEVNVRFDRAVTATGKPQVALTIGTQTRRATLSSWSTQSLYFSYSVQEGDRDEDGISIAANALVLNGGAIRTTVGAVDVNLTHEAVAALRGSKVNGSATAQPGVTDVSLSSSPATGDTYELGETIEVRVQFDRAVTATGKPQVALTIGAKTRHATLFGWGRQHLTFTYTVQEEDRDEDGASIAANALVLNGGAIRTTVGAVDVNLTHGPVAVERGNKVNGSSSTPPGVREIAFNSSPARGGTYELGETIELRVEFDRTVTIRGEPQVALTIGTQTRHATLSAWTTQFLHFEYTVQGEDRDEDGIGIAANALLLNGGTIKSADGSTDADLTHGPVAAGFGSKVNGGDSTPPKVRKISIISSPDRGGTYGLGETVEVKVEFDRAVAASGTPQVALTIGTKTRHATYFGWRSDALFFRLFVRKADRDEDGISVPANALSLSGGTIKATDGTIDADLAHSAVADDPTRKVNGSRSTP